MRTNLYMVSRKEINQRLLSIMYRYAAHLRWRNQLLRICTLALLILLPQIGYCTYTVSGTVFSAPDGLPLTVGGAVNGTASGTVAGQAIYVYIINQSGIITHRTTVANDGTYSIPGLVAGQGAAVQIATNFYPVNGTVFFVGLPSDYYAVGEGDLPAGDLTPDYSFPLAQASDVVVNFAFEERPSCINSVISTYTWLNGRLCVPVAMFNGSDPEDGAYADNLTGRTVDLYPCTPAGSTRLFYNDTLMDFLTAGSKITIDSFVPSLVSIAMTGPGAIRGFSYSVADNAGARSYVPATITTAAPLQINLASLTGRTVAEGNEISWTTASEKNNDYFIVERSTDGNAFTGIDKVRSVAANGNSSTLLAYSYTDKQAAAKNLKKVYYRLRAIDLAGVSTLSKILTINAGPQGNEEDTWTVYPVPAVGTLHVKFNEDLPEHATLQIIDATGITVYHQDARHAGTNKALDIDIRSLPCGHYSVLLGDGDQTVRRKQLVITR